MLQVNQAIEANIVRPELPEEADRVEQLLVSVSFLFLFVKHCFWADMVKELMVGVSFLFLEHCKHFCLCYDI